MTWPKRGTRKIVVDGVEYLWHFDAHCLWCSNGLFTVGQPGKPCVLYINAAVFGEEIRLKNVALSIKWAVSEGWSPEQTPSRSMSRNYETEEFYWVSSDLKHGSCEAFDPPES